MQPVSHPDWKNWLTPLSEIDLEIRRSPLFQRMVQLFHRYDSLAVLCSPVREFEEELLIDLNSALRAGEISQEDFDRLYWDRMENVLASAPADLKEGWHEQWRSLASATSMAAELGIRTS